ncbi:DUF5994 family protein [Gordonia soli]|uniref:Uncharacterized protein n=1 Tax=Gordonia soli NBRC 108243 TaxID=1223545 RepID=M0QE78_9ACTN|nr:DUF5994 family protein [Gordonia soli]GAC66865.1 hypothetical protein GS4_05_00740 [Gordonia soli NBRC 108243]
MKPVLGPTRLRIGADLTVPVAGAWFPYTSKLSDELSVLSLAVRPMLGDIASIEVTWRNFARIAGFDSENTVDELPLMTFATAGSSVTLLVIPPRTASSLAATLLRLAGDQVIIDGHLHSLEQRRAARILERATAQRQRAVAG